jgi:hypothetical protein
MSQVFVVETNKRPINLVHAGEARILVKQGKAAGCKRRPLTVEYPGNESTGKMLWAAELRHRGAVVKQAIVRRSCADCALSGPSASNLCCLTSRPWRARAWPGWTICRGRGQAPNCAMLSSRTGSGPVPLALPPMFPYRSNIPGAGPEGSNRVANPCLARAPLKDAAAVNAMRERCTDDWRRARVALEGSRSATGGGQA